MITVHSEQVEPFGQVVVGVGFQRFEDKLKEWKENKCSKQDVIDVANSWWISVDALTMVIAQLQVSKGELCHASIALSNHKGQIGEYIDQHLGFNPMHENISALKTQMPDSWYGVDYKYSSRNYSTGN